MNAEGGVAQDEAIAAAARSYLSALCAHRDAKRMLLFGFDAASASARKVLSAEVRSLAAAIKVVAAKEAADLLDLHDRDPDGYPAGRTAESALAAASKGAKSRYASGRCAFCKGPALPCARRHARGRSCA